MRPARTFSQINNIDWDLCGAWAHPSWLVWWATGGHSLQLQDFTPVMSAMQRCWLGTSKLGAESFSSPYQERSEPGGCGSGGRGRWTMGQTCKKPSQLHQWGAATPAKAQNSPLCLACHPSARRLMEQWDVIPSGWLLVFAVYMMKRCAPLGPGSAWGVWKVPLSGGSALGSDEQPLLNSGEFSFAGASCNEPPLGRRHFKYLWGKGCHSPATKHLHCPQAGQGPLLDSPLFETDV